MHSNELIDSALRVLSAIDHGRPPDKEDVVILKSNAQPDDLALSIGELASELILREIAKRRTARKKLLNEL